MIQIMGCVYEGMRTYCGFCQLKNNFDECLKMRLSNRCSRTMITEDETLIHDLNIAGEKVNMNE